MSYDNFHPFIKWLRIHADELATGQVFEVSGRLNNGFGDNIYAVGTAPDGKPQVFTHDLQANSNIPDLGLTSLWIDFTSLMTHPDAQFHVQLVPQTVLVLEASADFPYRVECTVEGLDAKRLGKLLIHPDQVNQFIDDHLGGRPFHLYISAKVESMQRVKKPEISKAELSKLAESVLNKTLASGEWHPTAPTSQEKGKDIAEDPMMKEIMANAEQYVKKTAEDKPEIPVNPEDTLQRTVVTDDDVERAKAEEARSQVAAQKSFETLKRHLEEGSELKDGQFISAAEFEPVDEEGQEKAQKLAQVLENTDAD